LRSLCLTGAVTNLATRQEIIDKFNTALDIPVLFLTTGVGGVGITLTGADRVIIYDPSWNPATDAQAVDRAFRVGQKRHVLVYRCVSSSSYDMHAHMTCTFLSTGRLIA
jgi:SNF2 family DNA or RNA helicase